MRYKLNTLYSTDQAFNGDVIASDEEKYMGRLYILTTSDSKLLDLGIKEEWFIAHASADFLISGHINNEGKWSLSPYKSLSPSLAYTNQTNIFDHVFSPEYVQEIAYLREEEFLNISQNINQSGNFDSNESDESDVSKPKILTPIEGQLHIKPENIDILRHLIFRSSLDELLSLNPEQDMVTEANQPSSENKSIFDDPSTNLTVIMNDFQCKSIPQVGEEDLVFAQIELAERVMDEYERQNLTEFAFVPFGNVTVYPEDSYFVLRDSSDNHTIFIATFDAEIIQGLSDVDALKIEMILSQIDTEDYRKTRDISKQEREVSLVNENAHNLSQQQGIEYGA